MRLVLIVTLAAACTESREAPTVRLPVATEGGGLAIATTDLGWTVTTTRVRFAARDLELTIRGEQHEATVFHPGHAAGGEVTGELPGPFLLDFDGTERALGTATLLAGDYHGANLAFRAAAAADGLVAADPMMGHVFHLTGVASRAGVDHPFDAVIDLEADAVLIGAVFDATITEATTGTLRLAFLPVDPIEGDTIYDGLDFATLAAPDGTVAIRPASVAHNVLRRPLQTHDAYAIHP